MQRSKRLGCRGDAFPCTGKHALGLRRTKLPATDGRSRSKRAADDRGNGRIKVWSVQTVVSGSNQRFSRGDCVPAGSVRPQDSGFVRGTAEFGGTIGMAFQWWARHNVFIFNAATAADVWHGILGKTGRLNLWMVRVPQGELVNAGKISLKLCGFRILTLDGVEF